MAPQFELDDTSEARLRVGRTLRDKWHLDALIDVGGMAAVYAATHRNGMRGAVKILHEHRSSDPDIVARFRREGYIANKVSHPNAVSVLDDDTDDDGSLFLVMELLSGSTLGERAAASHGRLTAVEVLLAVDPVLDVLAVAHDATIVHRDIKPENIFVTAEGQIKILDFGIARLTEPSESDHSQTMAGLPMGSPAYMSPEQARGRWDLVGPHSDVWSVGATMFTLLAGRDVHVEQTVPELLAAIFTKPAPSLATLLPDAPRALVDVVDRALKLRIEERWPDARAMQQAVRRAYAEMFGSPMPGAPREVVPASPALPTHRISIPNYEGRAPAPSATTLVAPDRPSFLASRYARRAALASAFIVAAALGIAGAERDSRSQEQGPVAAAIASPELVHPSASHLSTPTGAMAVALPAPESAASPAPAPVTAAASGTPALPASSRTPAVKVRYPSIYDRRR